MNRKANTQTDIGLGVTTAFTPLILEFGGGDHLLDWSLPGEGLPTLSVDVLAGGRFVDLDGDLTIETLVDVDRSQDWLDPFIGAQLTVDLIDRLSVLVRGDIGGFGVGSHFPWNMVALLAYQASQRITLGEGIACWTSISRRGQARTHSRTTCRCGGPCGASPSASRMDAGGSSASASATARQTPVCGTTTWGSARSALAPDGGTSRVGFGDHDLHRRGSETACLTGLRVQVRCCAAPEDGTWTPGCVDGGRRVTG
jgi:hypothetical protein